MLYLGIDPGVKGGLALISSVVDNICTVEMWDMPTTRERLMTLLLNDVLKPQRERYQMKVAFEKVGGFMGAVDKKTGKFRNKASAHTMFELGVQSERVLCCLMAAGMKAGTIVTPREWQQVVGITESRKIVGAEEWKRVLKRRAQQLFPGIKITLKTADALLIAYYLRLRYEGE